MTDDQDRRLGSTDFQPVLQRELISKGAEFTNHYTNTALCCPSRSTLLRGQTVHNTNLTNVVNPGGSYNKWVKSGQDLDYLPHWLGAAGYRTEYIGKIMNGYGLSNYDVAPKGWDWTDILLEPYIDDFNVPVLSQNGERPIYYRGFHQTDIIRIKSVDRLRQLTSRDQPFFLAIAPFAPHVGFQEKRPSHRPVPQQRHSQLFPEAKAPRTPNFNPGDDHQRYRGGWVKNLARMNESAVGYADFVYRSRAQSLAGVDEIIEDVVDLLQRERAIDNTYIIYTSDNGYHIGQHRAPAGKSLFWNEDTNLPFVVRGPGVPANVTSTIPGLHLDLAPTFLNIAGVAEEHWPPFFDGRSLLPQWHNPTEDHSQGSGQGNSKESINIEYWGRAGIEAPSAGELGSPFLNTTYKTIRTLGRDAGWVYTKWCSGEAELYNTGEDPFELTNLVHERPRVVDRLNALLMVTKSCERGACRDPWSLIQPPDGSRIVTLTQALDARYDGFFANFERVRFGICMQIQHDSNEAPYYPPLPKDGGLGRAYRNNTDTIPGGGGATVITDSGVYGTESQRSATVQDIIAASRVLSDEEITAR
ncbi:hypothetical protein DL770_001231 [Monosporascus sp. CRB-9-2]|nr:hypothetical protein DL770_001231 [Monosporascus sp. CRB-9-2]